MVLQYSFEVKFDAINVMMRIMEEASTRSIACCSGNYEDSLRSLR